MSVSRPTRIDSWRSSVVRGLLRLWYLPPDDPGIRRWNICFQALSDIYGLFSKRHRLGAIASRARRRLPVPVISVGNLVVGGTGKTPVSMWLAEHFREQGRQVAVLSRGYGRSSKEVAEVPAGSDWCRLAHRFGDEPVLMAATLEDIPVWVGKDRYASGMTAIRQSQAQLLILDDAFQHWPVHRDLDLVLLDARNPFGNGWLLPVGPLREPVAQLRRAHAIIVTHAQDAARVQAVKEQLRRLSVEVPVFACRYRLESARWGLRGPVLPREALRQAPVAAFAGIARPDSFFTMVQSLGVELVSTLAFPDHHRYRLSDLRRVLAPIIAGQARLLLTTEKDAVRLPPELQDSVVTLAVTLDFGEDPADFVAFLQSWAGSRRL